ncbi:MAG: hypothetical protein M3457_07830 [Chloroflexota bacterium]|nr:hypothetical protein [Chloroflexota bacterium]
MLIAGVAIMLAGMIAAPVTHAQDATETTETPDVVIPGTGDEDDPPVETTPEAPPEESSTEEPPADASPAETEPPADTEPSASSTSSVIQISATDPGNPAVIAHGLAFLTAEQVVWQVRETEPATGDQATSEISNAAFVYQVEGTSVIRNDVTGKRALLDPGEAYFKAGGDAYTAFADSADSLIWIFEVVGPSEVEADAFYESPLIDDYSEGVFDLLMIRYVLEPGEMTTLPDHTGPALVMSADGDIDIESGGLGLLATGDGQLIIEDATVTNNSENPAVFVMSAFGSDVGDETSSTGTASPETTDDPDTDTDTATDAETDTEAETTDEDPVTTEEPDVVDPPATDSGDTGSQTSINITAQAELYVVVVADGVTVFDGPIPDGGESGVIVGSTFEVYTSYGAGTLFTDACGNEFYMGYEEGEANYVLQADQNSCAP